MLDSGEDISADLKGVALVDVWEIILINKV